MVFPVVIYRCESWTIKKTERRRIDAFKLWCWRKTLESPLDCKEIQPVNTKGNQPWICMGRTDAKAAAPILWPPDVKSRLTGKALMLGKIKGKRIKGQQRMRWLDVSSTRVETWKFCPLRCLSNTQNSVWHPLEIDIQYLSNRLYLRLSPGKGPGL